jgi:hypothetical protein
VADDNPRVVYYVKKMRLGCLAYSTCSKSRPCHPKLCLARSIKCFGRSISKSRGVGAHWGRCDRPQTWTRRRERGVGGEACLFGGLRSTTTRRWHCFTPCIGASTCSSTCAVAINQIRIIRRLCDDVARQQISYSICECCPVRAALAVKAKDFQLRSGLTTKRCSNGALAT